MLCRARHFFGRYFRGRLQIGFILPQIGKGIVDVPFVNRQIGIGAVVKPYRYILFIVLIAQLLSRAYNTSVACTSVWNNQTYDSSVVRYAV
jgi:hypothetical protein